MNKKIDLMIVGAQKAGTTSLHKYLCEHPEIEGHFTIEFSYFIADEEYQKGFDIALDNYYNFQNLNPKVILAKSALFSNNEKAIKRLYEQNPKAKLVFLIREPVSRAFSSFTFEKMNGGMYKKNFNDISNSIEQNEKNGEEDSMYRILIKLGQYAEHLKAIYKYFSKKQIKIVLFEELKKEPLRICQEIFEFVKIDATFQPQVEKTHNKTKVIRSQGYARLLLKMRTTNPFIKNVVKQILPYRYFDELRTKLMDFNKKEGKYTPMQSTTEIYLKNYFKPYNEKLAGMIDKDISHWN